MTTGRGHDPYPCLDDSSNRDRGLYGPECTPNIRYGNNARHNAGLPTELPGTEGLSSVPPATGNVARKVPSSLEPIRTGYPVAEG